MHLDHPVRAIVALPLLAVLLTGCLEGSDPGSAPVPGTPLSDWTPDMLPDPVTDMVPIGDLGTDGVAGAWIHEDKAYLSGGTGLRIFDVTDPTEPVLLAAEVEGTTGSRDVDIMVHPDGRTYAVLAHGGGGITFTDVTDPMAPVLVATVTDIGSAHNIAVVPNSTLVYNSRSISQHTPSPGTTGQIDIVDFADPQAPSAAVFAFPAVTLDAAGAPKPVAATTCHDITFTPENQRAYCAGVTETHVWDISDPATPRIIQVIDSPLNNIHHGAWGAREGDILIIGDEFAGAVGGPICSDPVDQPYAGLWFWDISDLATPVPLGYYQISYNSVTEQNTALCTTHFGTLVEDRDLFVLGWYTAGVALIDFSDPTNPVEIAHWRGEGTNVWDARYYKGHVFTGDTARGVDVLELV